MYWITSQGNIETIDIVYPCGIALGETAGTDTLVPQVMAHNILAYHQNDVLGAQKTSGSQNLAAGLFVYASGLDALSNNASTSAPGPLLNRETRTAAIRPAKKPGTIS